MEEWEGCNRQVQEVKSRKDLITMRRLKVKETWRGKKESQDSALIICNLPQYVVIFCLFVCLPN